LALPSPSRRRGDYLGFTALPPLYWPLLALSMLCYVALSQLVKIWLLRKKWI
jgi:Mg2+-importing ATPase